jgi:enterochelin esterase-like enzyme
MNAHNKHDLIIVEMGFEKEPWYGDHVTDPNTRQASYLKEFAVPFIERHYSTLGMPGGRLLLGFNKSGWGAFSLILTYPEFFGYAASWDAPMFFDRFHYRMEAVYGTVEQLNAYRPDLLVSRQTKHFQETTRLVLTGERDWGKSIPAPSGGSHTMEMHTLLMREGVKHVYDDSLNTPHRWSKSWMAPTLEALMTLTKVEKRE